MMSSGQVKPMREDGGNLDTHRPTKSYGPIILTFSESMQSTLTFIPDPPNGQVMLSSITRHLIER